MQCSNSNSNSSGGGLIDRKPSYFGHPAGSVTLSSLSSLSSLNLSNIGSLSSGLSISNIPGTVSSNIHHTASTPPTYYDQIKYSMWNVWLSETKRNNVLFMNDVTLVLTKFRNSAVKRIFNNIHHWNSIANEIYSSVDVQVCKEKKKSVFQTIASITV